ncbi:MAG: trigger factor [Oscillospiraceae bacterium]|nr:trigger factor [Oscillospiraceae bacterium]
MAFKCEEVEKNLVKLSFEVSAEEFDKAIDRAYNKNKNKFNVPGFRKGKAPKQVVYRMYGKTAFYDEALNDLLPGAYEAALKESGLEVVARPEFDVEDIKEGEPVVYTALVTTKPEVKLGEYKGIKVPKIDYTITDEDVQKDIEATQQKNARLVSVDDRAVESGDIAVIDFEGFVDGVAFEGGKGEDYELEIGSNTFIPGFEDQLIGANVDDLVDVNVTFPEEYHAEELKGKDAIFKVKVNEIKVRELPEIDDDFASEVSDFDTLEEYKADVKKQLEEKAKTKAESDTQEAVVKQAVENAEMDIPEKMVENQVENMINDFAQRLSYQGMSLDMYLQYTGGTIDEMRAQYHDNALDQVKRGLVIEAIAAAEGVEASPEEVELELVDMSKKYNMELDKLKELMSEAEMDSLKKQLQFQKTVEMLANHAVAE